MKRTQSLLLGWGTFFTLLLLFVLNTSAHSYLAGVEPPLGTVFDAPPETVVLVYTQGPDTGLSEYFLRDADGEVIYQFTPEYEGEDNFRVLLHFDEPLPDGHYQISWLAVSTTDGHPTRGIVPLAIGVAPMFEIDATEPQTEVSDASPIRMIVRWLIFLSMTILAGGLIFPLILPRLLEADAPSTRPLMLGSFVVLILAGVIDIFMQSQEIGTSITKILFESRWGQFQLAKYLAALIIGGLFFVHIADHIKRYVLLGLGALMLLAQAFASHNSNLGPLGIMSDWAHLVAAALWLSGLAQLAWIWIPHGLKHSDEGRLELLKTLLLRFSQLALVSVILILVSGIYTALQHVTSWDALFNSLYGRALVAKGILLLPIMAMASYNRFGLIPKLRKKVDADAATVRTVLSRLKRWMALEAGVIVVILFFAATLTTTSPPQHTHAEGHHEPAPLVVSTQIEEYLVSVEFSPLAEGQRTMTIHVNDELGQKAEDVLRVMLQFDYLDQDLGDTFFNLVTDKMEDGSFQLRGPYLTLHGNWTFTTFVRTSTRANDLELPLSVLVEHDGAITLAEDGEAHDEETEHGDDE